MLPAAHRLRGERRIKQVAGRGRSFFGQIVSLRVLPSRMPVSRFAFIVSLKVAKKAVVRNTIKRRLREIVRKDTPLFKTGFDVMVIARPAAARCTYWQLRDALMEVSSRANLIR